MVTPPQASDGGDHTLGMSATAARRPSTRTVVGRRPLLTILVAGVASCCALALATAVWWIFQPPPAYAIGYALALLVVLGLAAAIVLLMVDRKPGLRVVAAAAIGLSTMVCGMIPVGTFYVFAVSHEPRGDTHSTLALSKYLTAEYGYFGDEPNVTEARRLTCSDADRDAILTGLGEIAPGRMRETLDSRGFRDARVRYDWHLAPEVGRWQEPTSDTVVIPQVLTVTTVWMRSPEPNDDNPEPREAQARSLHRAEFRMRRNSARRWCVHSARYLGLATS
jgi:hypothetical protein